MRILTISLTVLLSACATFGQMEGGLNALMNKKQEEAFQVLGYPTTKQEFGGDTVYKWSIDSTGAVVVPKTYSTLGTYGSTMYYSNTITSQVVPVNYNCMIKLVAGPYGRLKQWEYRGNYDGCRPFIKRLAAYAEKQKSPYTVPPDELNAAQREQCLKTRTPAQCDELCETMNYACRPE